MVLKEESSTSWWWPLARSNSGKTIEKRPFQLADEDEEERIDRERAFDIAERMEEGLAREIVTEFMHPLRRSSRLWRFHVVRSEDKLQYRLFSDDGDFLMYARTLLDVRRVEFFLYNPSEKESRGRDHGDLYDPSRPAFTMTFNKDKTEWRIVQEKCEHCQFLPRHLSCSCHGKQQVAVIRHTRKPIGDGIFNGMDVAIPGLYTDGSRVVWCPLAGRGDLGDFPEDNYEAQHLITKQPSWNDAVESLVLDFKGRNVTASAKNFQLALTQKPDHVICQFGKIGPQTFSLDFRYPLSVIQAFGMSLTTLFWT